MSDLKLHRDRTVALFMDFQRDVCAPGGKMVSSDPQVLERFATAIDRAGAWLDALRRADFPRAHVRHVFEPGYPELDALPHQTGMSRYVRSQGAFVEGEEGAGIVPRLAPVEGEATFRKHTLSPLASGGLAHWLDEQAIDTVVLSGVVTHYVILATALSAHDRGLRVVVASDACTSAGPERHEIALAILGPVAEIAPVEVLLAAIAPA